MPKNQPFPKLFFILQKPSLKSPPSVLSHGGHHVKFPSKISPLCRLLRSHNSHLWEFQQALMGNEPRRAWPGAAARCTRQESAQTWGVIGLSHRLACFPMWATAVGRPRGTIWKQHDTLQCRAGIHCSGYRERGQGTRNTKLKQRCLLALKRLPFGLLLTVGSICG